MKTRILAARRPQYLLLVATLLLFVGAVASAQVPVDDDGNPIGSSTPVTDGGDGAPVLSAAELEALVGPIALYPDDLLAIVLPASTYPLEIVQAARFLDDLENDSSLQPDESWDESIVALLNYPEVVRMMNDDIDWTWQLGEAVVAQQTDVVAAVESFRDRAYAAGNLKSDEYQTVKTEDDVIQIEPVSDDVIYVPYYEPEQVVVYQPRRVYYYYPRAYPVYYYPYPVGYNFGYDHFWGVTTAFSIGWTSHHLRVYHHSFHGHPYFGHSYYGHYWRQPSINIFNNYYGNYGYSRLEDRYRYGSYWRPRYYGGARPGHYEARSRYYSNRRSSSSYDGYADERDRRRDSRQSGAVNSRAGLATNRRDNGTSAERRSRDNPPVRFRSRDGAASATGERRAVNRTAPADAASPRRDSAGSATERRTPATSATERRTPATVRQSGRDNGSDRAIRFRERDNSAAAQSRRATGNDTARPAPATAERRASPSRPSTTRTAPTVRRPAPDTGRRAAAPAPRAATQPARRSTPTVQRSAPTVRRSAPQVQRSAPSVRRSSPQVQRSAPTTQPRAPQVQRSAPSVRRSAPTTRRAAPAAKRQSSSASRSTNQDRSSRRNRD